MNGQLQIDFLPVDSGEKSGDAIALRYGNFSDRSSFKVVVIDGGTMDSGNRLVKHIQEFYGTDHIDLVICTHPDADHASGLRPVLRNCSVGELWIHKPWDHSKHICDLFHDGRITDTSLATRLKDAYSYAFELVQIAEEKNINVREPFAGRVTEDGAITVLGPTIDYYRELIPDFARSPQAKTISEKLYSAFEKAVTWIEETFEVELLDESGETSAENRSSVITQFIFNNQKYLFTGDAGIESLENAIQYSTEENIDITNVRFMQIPHHGSKRNISPSILNHIKCETAFVSASKDAPKHPSRKVTNAFVRRGTNVYSTSGKTLMHQHNGQRSGWGSAPNLPFYNQVEE